MYHFRVQALVAVSNRRSTLSQVDVSGIHSKFLFFFSKNTAYFSGKLLIRIHLILASYVIYTTKFQQFKIFITKEKTLLSKYL